MKLSGYSFLLVILCSCILLAGNVTAKSGDEAFRGFRDYYIEQLWELYPAHAIYSGYHKYDSVLVVPDAANRELRSKKLMHLKDSLSHFREDKLSQNMRTDYWMIRDQIESDIWYLNEFRSYEWNPASYNIGGGFSMILNGRHAPLDDRLRDISKKLRTVKEYYAAARSSIKHPTYEHTELAVLQNKGSLGVFGEAMSDSVEASTLTKKEKKVLNERIGMARESISGYIEYLEKIMERNSEDDWKSYRIGKELYDAKFGHDIVSAFTAEEMYERANKRKAELHTKMAGLARKLWGKYLEDHPMPDDDIRMTRMVIEKISENHVHRDSFMTAIQKQIPELEKFVTEKDLIYLDPEKPLVVRQTPAYMEGSGAGASISSPGPYDKYGNTYYNVSPLTGYSDEDAESYLREYNHYILQILNIHEAIPGHYTQLVYANNSPSMVKSILGNGAMIEGWAVYSELLMLESGYGNNEPEMWLMYYKWHLRSVCNTILDYAVHVLDMPEEAAMEFLTVDAFQQKAEAKGKWRRVKLSQVQLCSYFTGFTEIYDLRESMKKSMGDDFDLRQFHEKFLSYGSAPVKYIGQLMSDPTAN